jgi:hypothetical protein
MQNSMVVGLLISTLMHRVKPHHAKAGRTNMLA